MVPPRGAAGGVENRSRDLAFIERSRSLFSEQTKSAGQIRVAKDFA